MTMPVGRAHSMSPCYKTLGMSRQSRGNLGGVAVLAVVKVLMAEPLRITVKVMQCVALMG